MTDKKPLPEFKLIVAGGRDFNNYPLLKEKLLWVGNELFTDKSVSIVSGMARGADALGYQFAKEHGIKVYEFPANWDAYGKAAGFRRNVEMARFSHGLLAFWDKQSRGTQHMIRSMEALNKYVHIVYY